MIDARGLLCPMPVVKVQQAVDTLEVLVDDPCAVENISRFAASNGYTATAVQNGEEAHITLTKK